VTTQGDPIHKARIIPETNNANNDSANADAEMVWYAYSNIVVKGNPSYTVVPHRERSLTF
jgi:hypothetical protein